MKHNKNMFSVFLNYILSVFIQMHLKHNDLYKCLWKLGFKID